MSSSTNKSGHHNFTEQEEILWDILLLNQNLSHLEEEIAYLKDKILRLSGRIDVLATKLNGGVDDGGVFVGQGVGE